MATRILRADSSAPQQPITVALTARQRQRVDAAIGSRVWPDWELDRFLSGVLMIAVAQMEADRGEN